MHLATGPDQPTRLHLADAAPVHSIRDMRIIAISLLAILGLGAADSLPDAAFTAKVEQALGAIRAKQADAASADFKALSERLAKAGVEIPKGDSRAMMLDLSAVQMRQIRLGGSRGMGLGFADTAAAEAAASRLDVDAIVAGSWIFYDMGPAAELNDLAGAMGGRIYNASEHRLGAVVPAPAPGAVRLRADEAAIMATMKSGIFPAQVQFQAGGYLDIDQDNVGEYGLLGQLAGRTPTDKIPAGQIKLLVGPFAQGDEAFGYRFKSWLPGADTTTAVSTWEELQVVKAPDANPRERHWTVYAWPAAGSLGKVFAISEDGMLRSQAWDGKEPAWNAVRGGKSWSDAPVWPPVTR